MSDEKSRIVDVMMAMVGRAQVQHGKFQQPYTEKNTDVGITFLPSSRYQDVTIYVLELSEEHQGKGICQAWLHKVMAPNSGVDKLVKDATEKVASFTRGGFMAA